MSEIENEKAILEEAPDFENQQEILDQEKKIKEQIKKFYTRACSIFLFIVLIFVVGYCTIDIYVEYGTFSDDACENVNINIDDTGRFPIINISYNNACVPEYNIDYYNNRRATFNLDIYGNRSYIFNPVNQMDPTGSYCTMNCDANNDGWPDYNIDLNGDGTADINIVKDPQNSTECDLNCDLNKDTLPDTNIDLDGDGNPDVNITGDDITKPLYNIDYEGNRIPTFNLDGGNTNKVNDATQGKSCTVNCDADGDGWPDYNITLTEGGQKINELVTPTDSRLSYDQGKLVDWKCYISKNLKGCKTGNTIPKGTYINIDVTGDGVPDVNLSSDGGATITNPINKGVDNKKLNHDTNGDGLPDVNIDVNNDGIPDINVTGSDNRICVENCDTNFDGTEDYSIDYDGTGKNPISIKNINWDTDFDGACDANCDITYDLYPDINIDTNGDGIPDVNVDFNGDNTPDFNKDTNGDGKPDTNLSAYGDGRCNFNCEDGTNPVSSEQYCTRNCDTDGDGWPDINVDVDNDWVCDINCNDGTTDIDSDKDYVVDEDDATKEGEIDTNEDGVFLVLNPLDIKEDAIEPGWEGTYILTIHNNAPYAVAYNLVWTDVLNEFTDENNLDYFITKNLRSFLNDLKAPRANTALTDEVIIAGHSSVKYVLKIRWTDTGLNQNIDSGKNFKGKLIIETIK